MIPSRVSNLLTYAQTHGVRAAGVRLTRGFRTGPDPDSTTETASVFDSDWDVAIVLHGCRVDDLHAVTDDYWFLPPTDSTVAPGDPPVDWIDSIVRGSPPGSTLGYVTAVPSEPLVSPEHIGSLVEVESGDGSETTSIPPETVSDRAIQMWRKDDVTKMIVHYQQPCPPFRNLDIHRSGPPSELFDRVRDGHLDAEVAREAYRGSIRWVLDDIESFIENVDAPNIVLTSDHGVAFGDDGYWGATPDSIESVRRVPWVVTSGEDNKTRIPGESQ